MRADDNRRAGLSGTHVRPVDRFMPARKADTAKKGYVRECHALKGERGPPAGKAAAGLTEDSIKGVVG